MLGEPLCGGCDRPLGGMPFCPDCNAPRVHPRAAVERPVSAAILKREADRLDWTDELRISVWDDRYGQRVATLAGFRGDALAWSSSWVVDG